MKTILIIHLVFAVLTIILSFMISMSAVARLRRRYAYIEFPKASVVERIFTFLRLMIFALLPVFNIVYCLVIIFKTDYLIQETEKRMNDDLITTIDRD